MVCRKIFLKKNEGEKQVKGLVKQTGFIYLLAVFFYFGLMFSCTGSKETTKEMSSEEQKRIADSLAKIEYDKKNKEMMIQYNLGNDEYRNNRWEKALPFFKKANLIDKELHGKELKYPPILKKIGDCYFNIENKDSARVYYEKYIKYEEEEDRRYDVHSKLIDLQRLAGNTEKYLEEFYIVIDILEKREEYEALKPYYETLAEIMVQRNNTEEALRIYNRLTELFPDVKEYKDNRLALMSNTVDEETLIKEYKANLQQYPNDTKIMNELIKLYSRRNENKKVIEMADRYLSVKKNDVEILKKKANAYLNLEEYDKALSIFNKLIEVDPAEENDKIYYCEKAGCYIAMKKFKTAVQEARKALTIDKDYGQAYIRIGEAYEGFTEQKVQAKGGYSKINFDDKLAFKKAYDTYKKATEYPATRVKAQNKMNSIKNLIPKQEDYFFHDEKEPKDPDYKWMF